jgi:hypothetical protein
MRGVCGSDGWGRRGARERSCVRAKSTIEDGEITELLALEAISLFRDGDEEELDSFFGADKGASGRGFLNRVADFDNDVERLSKDMFPAWFSTHVRLLVFPYRALAANHNLAARVTFQRLERCSARTEQPSDKVVVRILPGGNRELDALATVECGLLGVRRCGGRSGPGRHGKRWRGRIGRLGVGWRVSAAMGGVLRVARGGRGDCGDFRVQKGPEVRKGCAQRDEGCALAKQRVKRVRVLMLQARHDGRTLGLRTWGRMAARHGLLLAARPMRRLESEEKGGILQMSPPARLHKGASKLYGREVALRGRPERVCEEGVSPLSRTA